METTKMWSYSIEFYIEMRYIQVTPLGSKPIVEGKSLRIV